MMNNFEDDFDLNQEDCSLQQDDSEAGEQRNPIDESAPAESVEISTDEVADAENGAGERSTMEPSLQATQIPPAHFARGRIAHFMGALVAALIGKQIGADRPEKFANHHVLDGHPFQIRTISGSQNTFTVNPDTEPDRIIVAAKRAKESTEDVNCYALFGVLTADAIANGRRSGSRGHAKSAHIQVSLGAVDRVNIGVARIPCHLITATTADERRDLLGAIDALAVDQGVMDEKTVKKARAFVQGASANEAAAYVSEPPSKNPKTEEELKTMTEPTQAIVPKKAGYWISTSIAVNPIPAEVSVEQIRSIMGELIAPHPHHVNQVMWNGQLIDIRGIEDKQGAVAQHLDEMPNGSVLALDFTEGAHCCYCADQAADELAFTENVRKAVQKGYPALVILWIIFVKQEDEITGMVTAYLADVEKGKTVQHAE